MLILLWRRVYYCKGKWNFAEVWSRQTSVRVFWSRNYLSCCPYCCEGVSTIAMRRQTSLKSDWANLCHTILVPWLPQFLPVLWKREYFCKEKWKDAKSDWANFCDSSMAPSLPQFMLILLRRSVCNCMEMWYRAKFWVNKILSPYSSPIITSVPAYTVKAWVQLQWVLKPRGSLIEQSSVTVLWSQHYFSSCLYFCEDVCTIASGRETARNSDWAILSHSILVPSFPQFLPVLLWRRVYYCKGTSNRAECLIEQISVTVF